MTHTTRSAPGSGRRVTARHVQLLLALLWVLDGALQLQPFMFGTGFARQVIAPAGQGQPGFVSVPVAWAAHLVASQPVLLNTLFALTQLAIGFGLLWRPGVRAALGASVLWSVSVWYLGEGLGGVAGGQTSLLLGAPGAVLLYGLLAVAAWPRPALPAPGAGPGRWLATGRSDHPLPGWTVWAWAAIWVGDAVFNLLPGYAGPAATVAGNASGAPGWLAAVDHHVASGLQQGGSAAVAGLFVLELAVGLLPLLGRAARTAAVAVGLVLLAAMWVVGQSLGQIYSGQATDPNTAVPLAVMALGVLSAGPAVMPGWFRRGGRRRSGVAAWAGSPARSAVPAGARRAAVVIRSEFG